MDWTHIITASLVLLGTVVAAIVGGIGYAYKSMQAASERAIAKAEAGQEKAEKERDTFRNLLKDALETLPIAVNNSLKREGKAELPSLAPIVPISHSPVTPEQERQAEQFTALASIAAAKLALGMPPRVAEAPAKDITIENTVQDVPVEKKSL